MIPRAPASDLLIEPMITRSSSVSKPGKQTLLKLPRSRVGPPDLVMTGLFFILSSRLEAGGRSRKRGSLTLVAKVTLSDSHSLRAHREELLSDL